MVSLPDASVLKLCAHPCIFSKNSFMVTLPSGKFAAERGFSPAPTPPHTTRNKLQLTQIYVRQINNPKISARPCIVSKNAFTMQFVAQVQHCIVANNVRTLAVCPTFHPFLSETQSHPDTHSRAPVHIKPHKHTYRLMNLCGEIFQVIPLFYATPWAAFNLLFFGP